MLGLVLGIISRIVSNSFLNVFQKILTKQKEASSVVNLYTYLGLSCLGILICQTPNFSLEIFQNVLIMGFLGAFGNYFIIKALSCGELSSLAPINSYKPLVALLFGIIFLKEIPGIREVLGIFLIIMGTFLLCNDKIVYNKAFLFRFIALIFSAAEAIFIKKVIHLTDIQTTFMYWAISGLLFSLILSVLSGHPLKIRQNNFKYQIALVMMVAIMQYSTNYVFSKMNVAYALALFQLSTILSVFLGVNLFNEKGLLRKLLTSVVMLVGAVIIILK